MEAQSDDTRVITRFRPTLLHLATVKVAFLLMKVFDYSTLMEAYKRIQEGNLIDSIEIYKDPNSFNYQEPLLKCQVAQLACTSELLKPKNSARRERELEFQKRLLKKRERNMIKYCKTEALMKEYNAQETLRQHILRDLRPRVMEAVEGIEYGVRRWKKDHLESLGTLEEECGYYWYSDGTFDGEKTAQQLVLNANIDIRTRFRVACTYCFEEIIHALWSELNAAGQIENFLLSDNAMVHFWVRRLQDEPQVHWTQAFRVERNSFFNVRTFFSSVFPLLQPQDRWRFLWYLRYSKLDDFRLCMQVMTEEEEKYALVRYPFKLLQCYLQWPLRRMFHEIVKKVWGYLDYLAFLSVLKHFLFIKEIGEVDISELFEDFWERSPRYWRKIIKQRPAMWKKIKSWLKEIRKKKNAHFNELRRLFKKKRS